MTAARTAGPSLQDIARPGACFVIERLIDEVARAVGREPNDVRALNLVRPEQMPFTTIGGMRLDSGNYAESVRLCAELRKAGA
jgi:carbon-monoxide dehydrogenase large subunit